MNTEPGEKDLGEKPKESTRDVGGFIRDLRRNARISLRQLAQQAGVSNPYLSQIERGLRKPSAEILNQIAKGLRISSQALYVQAGLIEDREPPSDVITAIRADPLLTERQRQVLIDIYESFRKEAPAGDEQTSQNAHPQRDSETDDERPLPPELLAALEPYAASAGNGAVNQETKEG